MIKLLVFVCGFELVLKTGEGALAETFIEVELIDMDVELELVENASFSMEPLPSWILGSTQLPNSTWKSNKQIISNFMFSFPHFSKESPLMSIT